MHVRFYTYSIPLTHQFRNITQRSGLIAVAPDVDPLGPLVSRSSAVQVAEMSPFWDYGVPESSRWVLAGLEALRRGYPQPVRSRIPVNVTVPAVGPEEAERIAARSGAHTAKVKIAQEGQTHADDVERIEAVRSALPSAAIRVDVNGKWSVEQAVQWLPDLDRAAGGLQYAEQPCATTAELAQLRRLVSVPIAADESIRRVADPLEVRRLAAADVAVIKNQPLGGVWRALELADQLGLPTVVSSALETSVGLAAGLGFAAALPRLDHACGLGTLSLFDGDTAVSPIVPVDGFIGVPETLTLNPAAGADAALTARWAIRLTLIWAHLQATGKIGPEDTYELHSLRDLAQ
ncbi:O-succinylbenzoate synthase [Arcanobacterium wilhelmae]|uniref:o-succinylbenzoate synthase n=1 Tax=Arcanobacterium wilhelmae TaxID=1803177 RepID=A0ABT9NA26_9ACTO|nr:o-succinylbenzoate synthase [Arcanobacterium wilhelmae]MDP9800564.1 O-succinylbenzoate synthase [Arcanobacterium wilhelmae]